MTKLFKLGALDTGNVSIALRQAQTWLRNLTVEDLDRFLEKRRLQIEEILVQLRKGQQLRFLKNL